MDLKSLLEESSVEGISKKTNVPVDILKKLVEHDFSTLKKAQALGFLSILERDYNLDLGDLKRECKEFFGERQEEDLSIPIYQVKPKGKKRWWFLGVLLLLLIGVLSMMVYDYIMLNGKKQNQIFLTQEMVLKDANVSKNIPEDMVANGTISKDELKEIEDEDLVFDEEDQTGASNAVDDNSSTIGTPPIIVTPKYKLWFGVYDMMEGTSSHQIIKEAYEFDATHDLLIATSKAFFSIEIDKKSKSYEDSKEHYFMIKEGKFGEIERAQFIELGGPKKW